MKLKKEVALVSILNDIGLFVEGSWSCYPALPVSEDVLRFPFIRWYYWDPRWSYNSVGMNYRIRTTVSTGVCCGNTWFAICVWHPAQWTNRNLCRNPLCCNNGHCMVLISLNVHIFMHVEFLTSLCCKTYLTIGSVEVGPWVRNDLNYNERHPC